MWLCWERREERQTAGRQQLRLLPCHFFKHLWTCAFKKSSRYWLSLEPVFPPAKGMRSAKRPRAAGQPGRGGHSRKRTGLSRDQTGHMFKTKRGKRQDPERRGWWERKEEAKERWVCRRTVGFFSVELSGNAWGSPNAVDTPTDITQKPRR